MYSTYGVVVAVPNQFLSALTKLQRLDLSKNKLSTLPDALGSPCLRTLCVGHNNLIALPSTLPPTLTTLHANDNQISDLTPIVALKSLVHVQLQENDIASLPSEIGQLLQLQTLRLEFNALSTLPIALARAPALKVLTLNGNAFENVPACLSSTELLNTLEVLIIGLLHDDDTSTNEQLDKAPLTYLRAHSTPAATLIASYGFTCSTRCRFLAPSRFENSPNRQPETE